MRSAQSSALLRSLAAFGLAAALAVTTVACTSSNPAASDSAVSSSEASGSDASQAAPDEQSTSGTDTPAGDTIAPEESAADGSSADAVETPAVDQGDGSPATLPPPLPNTIDAAPSKVLRDGQPATPSITADSVAFSAPVEYGDNTVLTITKATKQVETGNGPGVFSGREFVKFDLELTNDSEQPIDLNSVVVTTYYGGTNQLAAPVYTPSAETADFTGTLAPGAKATASYGFAVPTEELGNVTMVVDFDAAHSSATFTGAVNPA